MKTVKITTIILFALVGVLWGLAVNAQTITTDVGEYSKYKIVWHFTDTLVTARYLSKPEKVVKYKVDMHYLMFNDSAIRVVFYETSTGGYGLSLIYTRELESWTSVARQKWNTNKMEDFDIQTCNECEIVKPYNPKEKR